MIGTEPENTYEELEEILGHRFQDKQLLVEALSHRSWASEEQHATGRPTPSNERLEFLGDAVLQLVVTVYVYKNYRSLSEGQLAKARASVVSSAALSEVANELGLGAYILLGKGEEASGGREKPSILADVMEALIGAVYLDAGWKPAESLVMRLLGNRIDKAAAGPGGSDYKTRLQELALREGWGLPQYSVEEEGPDHAKKFFAKVAVAETFTGSGEGRSKKQAEQSAARAALELLDSLGDRDDA